MASVEQLPSELLGRADPVRVNFPWAGLLRGILLPDPNALAALKSLMAPAAELEIVLSYDPEHDRAATGGEALPPLDETYIRGTLKAAYSNSGLEVTKVRRLDREEALAIPATWGRRLLHGRLRDVFFIRVTAS